MSKWVLVSPHKDPDRLMHDMLRDLHRLHPPCFLARKTEDQTRTIAVEVDPELIRTCKVQTHQRKHLMTWYNFLTESNTGILYRQLSVFFFFFFKLLLLIRWPFDILVTDFSTVVCIFRKSSFWARLFLRRNKRVRNYKPSCRRNSGVIASWNESRLRHSVSAGAWLRHASFVSSKSLVVWSRLVGLIRVSYASGH